MENQRTIKEEAEEYTPPSHHNISELKEVSVSEPLMNGTGVDKQGKEFKYKFILHESEEYRVPNIVIGMLKDHIEANPKMTRFKVKKTGQDLATRYTVIPLG